LYEAVRHTTIQQERLIGSGVWMRDQLFQEANHKVRDFVFDDDVAGVFDDMLERSVPFYSEVQRMVVELAERFLDGNAGAVYDIGCSTGNTLHGIASRVAPDRAIRFVGLEPSPAMREMAAKKLADIDYPERVELLADEIQTVERLPDARVITMLYTLQFVRPLHRLNVLRMCSQSLQEGGCLILAEKILAEDASVRRLCIDLYHDYKRRHGYTSTEILRKREALENVLIPFSSCENIQLLREAGFRIAEPLFQWYNFAVYLAVKE
jgi:tRNA (cmo5U34)-methyltransferase